MAPASQQNTVKQPQTGPVPPVDRLEMIAKTIDRTNAKKGRDWSETYIKGHPIKMVRLPSGRYVYELKETIDENDWFAHSKSMGNVTFHISANSLSYISKNRQSREQLQNTAAAMVSAGMVLWGNNMKVDGSLDFKMAVYKEVRKLQRAEEAKSEASDRTKFTLTGYKPSAKVFERIERELAEEEWRDYLEKNHMPPPRGRIRNGLSGLTSTAAQRAAKLKAILLRSKIGSTPPAPSVTPATPQGNASASTKPPTP